jgi:hypothetical protein
MSIDVNATYRDGALHPETPLGLPENTPVRVHVVPQPAGFLPDPFPTSREEVIALRPQSPRITVEEFNALIDKYSVSVGTLPEDFSRADIYNDHD